MDGALPTEENGLPPARCIQLLGNSFVGVRSLSISTACSSPSQWQKLPQSTRIPSAADFLSNSLTASNSPPKGASIRSRCRQSVPSGMASTVRNRFSRQSAITRCPRLEG